MAKKENIKKEDESVKKVAETNAENTEVVNETVEAPVVNKSEFKPEQIIEEKPDISKISNKDLIEYNKMNEILFTYYDNQVKANEGMYSSSVTAQAQEYKDKRTKYNKIKKAIFNEMEIRMDKLKI